MGMPWIGAQGRKNCSESVFSFGAPVVFLPKFQLLYVTIAYESDHVSFLISCKLKDANRKHQAQLKR